ncbi:MAG: SAM-dependent chlorinase/fluorinase [Candidatus Omnitrophica bacterium]|nr:SAM-dependent chlorinase/fluorinase [Candidatus Omnitrophota bacterium]
MPIITLLTDFGTKDSYVAQMQGVILSALPEARIVHLGHEIPPQNVRKAGLFLLAAYGYYPAGTLHVVVVDPGVGTGRKILAIETSRYRFLVPDNGLIGPVLENEKLVRAVTVTKRKLFREPVSTTFHGRDCFAPAAAHWVKHGSLRGLGPAIPSSMIKREKLFSAVEATPHGLQGLVMDHDTFGNLITNIHRSDLARLGKTRKLKTEVLGHAIPGLSTTYADGKSGEPIALIGSLGFVEIAVNRGSALKVLTGKTTFPARTIRVRIK